MTTAFKEIFPACASTSKWRELYRNKSSARGQKKSTGKSKSLSKTCTVDNQLVPQDNDSPRETNSKTKRKINAGQRKEVEKKSKISKAYADRPNVSRKKPPRTVQPAAVGQQKNFQEKLPTVEKLKKTASVGSELCETFCLVCGETFQEAWIQCHNCQGWAHEQCAQLDDGDFYFCDNCKK